MKAIDYVDVSIQNRFSGKTKFNSAELIYSLGNQTLSWSESSIIQALPHHLCDPSGGQLGHGHLHQDGLQTTNIHVLFSQTPGFYWSLLLNHCGTQNVSKFCCRSKYTLLLFLCYTTSFLSCVHYLWTFYSVNNAPWPLCDHL